MNVRREDRVVKVKVPTVVITLTQEEFEEVAYINSQVASVHELGIQGFYSMSGLKGWVDALVEKCKETLE